MDGRVKFPNWGIRNVWSILWPLSRPATPWCDDLSLMSSLHKLYDFHLIWGAGVTQSQELILCPNSIFYLSHFIYLGLARNFELWTRSWILIDKKRILTYSFDLQATDVTVQYSGVTDVRSDIYLLEIVQSQSILCRHKNRSREIFTPRDSPAELFTHLHNQRYWTVMEFQLRNLWGEHSFLVNSLKRSGGEEYILK